MQTRTFISAGLLCLVGISSAQISSAQDQIYARGWLGGTSKTRRATADTGTVSVSDNGITGAFNSSASHGRAQVRAYSFPATYPYNFGYADGIGYWYDTITIQPDNPALIGTPGTAVFTYYLNGSASTTDYQSAQFNVSTECFCGGPSTYGGTPINSSFTITRGFTFGSPFQIFMEVSSLVHGYTPESMDVSLTAGGVTVTDGGGNPAAFSSTSSMGAGRSVVVTNGNSYAGFTVTNTLGHQTAAMLLGGIANTNETLSAVFTASSSTNGIVSDELDFSGTDTNQFVLQVAYDIAAVVSQHISETNLSLKWFQPVVQIWTNAICGNSDGGASNQFFLGAFDPGKLKLGNWGVDTVAKTVWAVLDHNSRFAVGGPVALPPLLCTGIAPMTNGITIFLQGPPAGPIFVDQTSDLTTTNWTSLGEAIPDVNGAAQFTDAAAPATNSLRFYRARQ